MARQIGWNGYIHDVAVKRAGSGKQPLIREKHEPLVVPNAINECWSMDFMHDQLEDGRSY